MIKALLDTNVVLDIALERPLLSICSSLPYNLTV